MRILFLAHRLPYPPDKGDKIRSYHELEYLARRHDVWCACFVDDPADVQHVAYLRTMCRDVAAIRLNRKTALLRGMANLTLGGTLTEGFYRSREMTATLMHWCGAVAFDAVLVFSSGMAPHGLRCPASGRVIDFCDWDSLKWAAYADKANVAIRSLYRLEAKRLAKKERRWIQQFDAAVIITTKEADEISDPQLCQKLHVVRNGVERGAASAPPNPMYVGFVGAMDYVPNIEAVEWFAYQIWPKVQAQHPKAVFRIIGRKPAPRVGALRRIDGVQVVGPVDNAALAVAECAIHVAPMTIGRGIQNKVLEAMAAARPVVMTSVAARGINPRPEKDCFIADEAETFASRVCQLLGDPVLCREMGCLARSFITREFDWSLELPKLETLISRVCNAKTSPRPHESRAFGEVVIAC